MNPSDFWTGFLSLRPRLERALDHDQFEDSLVEEVEELIQRVGDLGWEIGPYKEGYFLALSAADDDQLRTCIEELLRSSPKLTAWTFFAEKQPREWVPRFAIRDQLGLEHWVDASAALFSIIRGSDGDTLLLKRVKMETIPEGLKREALEILLDGLVGEHIRRQLVAVRLVPDAEFGEYAPIALLQSSFRQPEG